jgi:hypothetical protein
MMYQNNVKLLSLMVGMRLDLNSGNPCRKKDTTQTLQLQQQREEEEKADIEEFLRRTEQVQQPEQAVQQRQDGLEDETS